MGFGYSEFQTNVWSAFVQQELETKAILWDWCWKKFEGEAKFAKEVTIVGLGDVTVKNYTGAAIDAPENVTDTEITLKIDQYKYTNFKVDNVIEAQSKPDAFKPLMANSAYKLSLNRDTYIAGLAADATQYSSSTQIDSAADAKTIVDNGLLALAEKDVEIDGSVVIEIPWFVYMLLRDKYIELDTSNSEMLKKGIVGRYMNAHVRPTNNLYNDGTDDYAMIRTNQAIAAVGQINTVEAYKHPDYFADVVRSLNVFGARIVNHKQLYVCKVHK